MDLRALRTTLIHALKALKYLHSRGIIHGDINPANLMVDHRKRVKVGDFGIARRVARTDGSVSRGAAKYMAPEALSGDIAHVGPSSDLYSLGFSCYELMCGSAFADLFPGLNPDAGNAQAAWMMWHAAPDRKLPPISHVLEGVPPDLAAVIERMIEKNPKARFQSADEVLSQLGDDSKGADRETTTSGDMSVTVPTPPGPRWWVVAVFAVSVLLSLSMLFIPTGPTKPMVAPASKHAIVRKADLTRNVLEIEDQITGIPEEAPLPPKSRIRLRIQGEAERFILPKDILLGDWVEIQPAATPEGEAALFITRPIHQSGEVRQLDAAAGQITVSISSGRLKDELVMHVPERAQITLNGQPAKLMELRRDDRVEVEHLLDPRGVKGELVSTLVVLRTVEWTGFVESIDLPNRTLKITDARGQKGGRMLTMAPDATLAYSSGQSLPLEDLRAGDRIAMQADSHIRAIVVTRGDSTDTGLFLESRGDGTFLMRADSGNELLLSVTPETDIRLGQEKVTIDDLRPQIDRLNVTIHSTEGTQQTATAIDVTRGVRHDRWAIIIGNGTYDDRTLTPLPHLVPAAESLHRTLIGRYSLDRNWSALLVDQDVQTVRDEFQRLLPRVTEPMQLIVAVLGHGYLGPDGKAYIAFKDFQWSSMEQTGLPLDGLVDLLERCPAKEKLLLLDLTHTGDHPDVEGQPDLPKLLLTLQTPLKTVRIIGASSEGERSVPLEDGRRSWFGSQLDRAFAGSADADRNLTISADELMKSLESAAFDSDPPSQQHPFLWPIPETP
jgi:eukaryotic-like serine/threonine-protein kinase